ncbi:NUDIX domain-containing protein [candidate division KSB1 bacterium]|nr:NUDIX domain-containing protein [candidate division KSB1 bacterium]
MLTTPAPVFNNIIDPQELLDLKAQSDQFIFRSVEHYWQEPRFSDWVHSVLSTRKKRGEAVLVVEKNERILLHTKSFYPSGTWRLLSGGIHYDESILSAARRELSEETGFTADRIQPMGAILYQFKKQNVQKVVPFASFLFYINSTDKNPRPEDETEDIAGFKWINYRDLATVSGDLGLLHQHWQAWGKFRAMPHDIAHRWLLNYHTKRAD